MVDLAQAAQLLLRARTEYMGGKVTPSPTQHARVRRLEGGGRVEYSVQCGHKNKKFS